MPGLSTRVINSIRAAARPLTGQETDFDPLIEMIGDARLVLLGPASYGTAEFYAARTAITRRLIRDRGFTAVAVDADWSFGHSVNRAIHGNAADAASAHTALGGSQHFPQWPWRNREVLDFVAWLRSHNHGIGSRARPAGVYGLDLYGLSSSIDATLTYLDHVDPEAARRARMRFACMDHFAHDPRLYGYVTVQGKLDAYEDEVVSRLAELQRRAATTLDVAKTMAADEALYTGQYAHLARNADEYYRAMYRAHLPALNLRARHMAETLDALAAHLDRDGTAPKIVIWAHSSQVGDTRATARGTAGQISLGQLVREERGDEAVLVGFTTSTGMVMSATAWNGRTEAMRVLPALDGSYEALFHLTDQPQFLLNLRGDAGLAEQLREGRLERAIGVIYHPESERASHYLYAQLPDQFDAVLHFDETRALTPLDTGA